MSFVLIVKRPNQFIFNNVENAILSLQNKYSLGQPFIVYNKQKVLLQKIGYNYLSYPENFGAFGERYILIFFGNYNLNIDQYFYKDSFLSQAGIYFNALNNYDIDYVYTNVATPIRSNKNTLENIYSVQGIPLSFIDETNIKFVYTRPHGVNLTKSGSDPYEKGIQSYPYKDTTNGRRYITDNYNQALLFTKPSYNPSFDKLIIYNRGSPCRYLLTNATSFSNSSPGRIPKNSIPIISLTNTNLPPNSTPEVYLGNDYPQIFDIPAALNMYTKYNAYVTGQQNIWQGQVLLNTPEQIQGTNVNGLEWNFDLIEKASSTLCGNNNLVFDYPQKSTKELFDKSCPKRIIQKSDLLENSEFNTSTGRIQPSSSANATFRYSFRSNNQNIYNQNITNKFGRYRQFYKDEFTTPPDFVSIYVNSSKNWQTVPYSVQFLLTDDNIFQWSKIKYDNFISFHLPSNGDKTSIILHNKKRDFLNPSAYLRKSLNNETESTTLLLTSKTTPINTWGILSRSLNAYSIHCGINLNSYDSYSLKSSSSFWETANVETDFIQTTINESDNLSGNPISNTNTVDQNFSEILAIQSDYNFVNTDDITSHAIDDQPFSLGIRMSQNSFDYKSYFQFRHFPKLILKKTFNLDYAPTDILPFKITSPTFNLNSLQVQNYNQISCFLLPCNSTDKNTQGKSRGISIKCSLAKTIRGIGQFLYLERGKDYNMNFQKFINSSTFFFEIFCPQVVAENSTLFRTINNSLEISIFLIFK